MALIQVGADAPDFQAKTGSGKEFRLSEATGSSRVMLVFYPKDFTPGCTTQLVHVQQSLADMRAAGVEPEYLELRSAQDLSPVERVNGSTLLAVAARVGRARLIDNTILGGAK